MMLISLLEIPVMAGVVQEPLSLHQFFNFLRLFFSPAVKFTEAFEGREGGRKK